MPRERILTHFWLWFYVKTVILKLQIDSWGEDLLGEINKLD